MLPNTPLCGSKNDAVGEEPLPASFRDPSGYVFRDKGEIFRRVAPTYDPDYRRLMDSGLYGVLTGAGLLIPHEERGGGVLHPRQLAFVSYPYEWSFGQWKDAALATLAVQERALDFGMTLKDASAFNMQFDAGKPLLIDTLSFETYREGEPWVGYRQFCEHFLAPLALMARCDARLGDWMRVHLDGIPLDLATRLLPWSCRLNPFLFAHLYMQSHLQKRGNGGAKKTAPATSASVSLAGLRALLESLGGAVNGLRWEPSGTTWGDYYDDTNYSPAAMTAKESLVSEFLDVMGDIRSLWDFGANDARFSRLASVRGIQTVAFDMDPAAVEKAYRAVRQRGETHLLPLRLDLMNPSTDSGWAQRERMSLVARGPADAVFALALVHHLAIGNNVPLTRIADFFAQTTRRWLVAEFVSKEDGQAQRLLRDRRDIFHDYRGDCFEAALTRHFRIARAEPIPGTVRVLYLLEKRT